MSTTTVKFIEKEYIIPNDVITYIDLLDFTNNVQNELVNAFINKLVDKTSKDDIPLIDDKDLDFEIQNQINKYISMLCEKGIYSRIAKDYLINSNGYKTYSNVNKAALEKMKSILMDKMDEWIFGYENAVNNAESHVTGMGFDLWSGSFVNHAIYATMEASTINKQSKEAEKQYKKDMQNLSSELSAKYDGKTNNYVNFVYIPNMKKALAVLSYELMDKYVLDLIDNNKFDKNALKFVDIERSNDLLKNLKLSPNKKEILYRAFECCPYNLQVYLETYNCNLLNYTDYKTADYFKQGNNIISYLSNNLGDIRYPKKFKINYDVANCIAKFNKKDVTIVLKSKTKQFVSSIMKQYQDINNLISNKLYCYEILRKYDENSLVDNEIISSQLAKEKVESVCTIGVWDELVNKCGHSDLISQLREIFSINDTFNTKKEIDDFLVKELTNNFEKVRKDIVNNFKLKQKEEEKRRLEEEERKALEIEIKNKRINKIVKICCAFILSFLVIVFALALVEMIKEVIEEKIEYHELISIIQDNEDSFNYEDAIAFLISNEVSEKNKKKCFEILENEADFKAFDVNELVIYVPEEWEQEEHENINIASYDYSNEQYYVSFYIKYLGIKELVEDYGTEDWILRNKLSDTTIPGCSSAYVKYNNNNEDGENDKSVSLNYYVECDGHIFKFSYYTYGERFFEEEATMFLNLIDFSNYNSKSRSNLSEEKYSNAIELINEGKYSDAIMILRTIEEYKDSNEKIIECTNKIKEEEFKVALDLFVGEYIPVGETIENLKSNLPDFDDYTLLVSSDGTIKNVPYISYKEENIKLGNGIIESHENFDSDFCEYIIKIDDDSEANVVLSYHIKDGTMFLKTDKEEIILFYADYKLK